jgi:hypothetical protein
VKAVPKRTATTKAQTATREAKDGPPEREDVLLAQQVIAVAVGAQPGMTTEYDPTERERAALAKHGQRRSEQIPAPRLRYVEDWRGTRTEVDHPDQGIADALLLEAFGTADLDFYNGLLAHIMDFMDVRDCDAFQKCSETELNFIVSVIKNGKPKDELHAMLLAQMAITHLMAVAAGRDMVAIRKKISDGLEYRRLFELPHDLFAKDSLLRLDFATRTFKEAARTFTAQMEAATRYRTNGQSSLSVTNLAVGEGSQAILANVTQAAPKRMTEDPGAVTDERSTRAPFIGDSQTKRTVARTRHRKNP